MTELKPCPFCGRIPTVDDCGDNRFFVRCKCGIVQDKLYGQRCDAVKRWNTRRQQPDVPDTNVGDTISRQAAIDVAKEELDNGTFYDIPSKIESLPSAQPEQDEWCTDCKEYDSEKHCCPRFNRVIRNALKDAQPEKKEKWIVHPEVKNVYGGTYIECSQCGEKYVVQHMEDEKYCRNCGAKMDDDDIPMEYFENGGI